MSRPTISVVLSCSVIERQALACIEYIRRTQPAECIELFLVCWEGIDYAPQAQGFQSVTTVTFARDSSLNVARAKAVRMATADFIVVTEDHARFTGPWVQRLPVLFAEHDVDAVGWTAVPADRTSAASWSGYLVEYGVWGPGTPEGYSPWLPGHNCSYRRTALLQNPDMLEHYLQAEFFYHLELGRRGRRLYFTREFTLEHAQFLSVGKFLLGDFWYGWGFGATRAEVNDWGMGKRLLYALLIPLKIPLRWAILLRSPRDPAFFPRGIVWKQAAGITLGYVVGAMGEFCAYVLGEGNAHRRLTRYEIGFDRSEP